MTDRRAKPTKSDLQAASRLKAIWKSRAPELGLTQESAAGELDMTQGAVSQYINGLIPLNFNAVMSFAKLLGCEPAEIRDDLDEFQHLAKPQGEADWTDVTGYAQAAGLGDGVEADEYAESHKLKFKVSSLRKKGLLGKQLAVFYGKGDSMLPRIHSGDAILFDETDTKPRDETVFVVRVGTEYYVKMAEILDGTVYFRSTNPDGDHQWKKPRRMDSERNPIEIIGRVRWIGSWED